jgi:hypothetical protein
MRKSKQSKPMDVYTVSASIRDDKPHTMGAHEIAAAEFWAIGIITVQWAYLEHLLLLDTSKMANTARMAELPSDATSFSFSKRLTAWRLIVEETVKNKTDREWRLKLTGRIASVAGDRHKITHGLWQWFPDNADRLRVYSFRPRVAFTDDRFSLRRLLNLGQRIGAINFELAYVRRNGQQWTSLDILKQHARRLSGRPFSYVSRGALLELTGKGHLNPNPLFAKLPASKPPLSSSKG